MTQYIFDVTALRAHLARHARLSGIQRVSVMTIVHARDMIGAAHVWLGYLERRSDNYRLVQCPADPAVDLGDPATLRALLKVRVRDRALPGMARYAGQPIRRRLAVWCNDVNGWLGRERPFARQGLSSRQWRAARRPARTPRSRSDLMLYAVARPGDHLVFLDNAWQPRGLARWLRRARQETRLNVSVLMHDLIPVVAPHHTEADSPARLYDWLTRASEHVSLFLANSENTARDLRAFLDHHEIALPIEVVPLAQTSVAPVARIAPVVEETAAGETAPDPRMMPGGDPYAACRAGAGMPDRVRALTKRAYVLSVGTREIRKNLWGVATVWDRLRRTRGRDLPKLVIAGQPGWLNDDFDRLMAATGHLGGWVEIVDSPSDRVLDYLYRNCLFTITASFYEGWGLPIGESLAYGKTAVVSNTSAMPEVGRDLVEYCTPHSLDDIEAACLRLLDDPGRRLALEARIAAADLRGWDDVAADILNAVAGHGSGQT